MAFVRAKKPYSGEYAVKIEKIYGLTASDSLIF